MHIKKGDNVKILVGKDRAKTGKVLMVNPKTMKATVEGQNLYFRHERPKKSGQKGQKIKLPMPIHISNLMVIDSTTKKPGRTGQMIDEKGQKKRVSKKSKKIVK